MNAEVEIESDSIEPFRTFNLYEQHRLDTYKDWPFSANSSCSVTKMAEAGFYFTGNKRENDAVTCFVCSKALDGWESEDDPWQEHRKHAPQCEFVRLGCAEKDLTVEQFLGILHTVLKGRIEKNTKEFKQKFADQCEVQLDKFKRNAK